MLSFIDIFSVLEVFDNLHMLENLQLAKGVLNGHSGIYAFVHIETGTSYIGSSVDLYGRIMDHIQGHSSNLHLQYAIAKYGLSSFVFVILQYCKLSDLLKREQHFLDILFSLVKELRFNFNPTAGSPLGVVRSEETRDKMSDSQSGAKNPMYGKTHTPESKAQMSYAHTGKTHTPESRAKMSDSQKLVDRSGANNPVSIQVNVYSAVNNQLVHSFSSQVAVAKWLGVTQATVSNYIQSGKVWNKLYVFRKSS